jgi:pimeloyl-ACP methyl ester carboxylesterase
MARQLQLCLQELQLGQILLLGVGYSAHLALATAALHPAITGVLLLGVVPGRLVSAIGGLR